MLLEFTSRKCGLSRKLDAHLAHILAKNGNHDTFRRRVIDIADRPDLFERFHVEQTPTLIVVDKGKIAARMDGIIKPKDVAEMLEPWMRRYDGRFGPRGQWKHHL